MDGDQLLDIFNSKIKSEFDDLLEMYAQVLRALKLSGSTPMESVLASVCDATLNGALLDAKREKMEEIQRKNQLLETRLKDLKKDWITFTQNLKNKEARKQDFESKAKTYHQKFLAYNKEVKNMENELRASGFTVALTEESLQKLIEKNNELHLKLAEVTKKLEEYDFEPTNEDLLSKIEEMKSSIREFDKYFNRESL